MFSWCDPGVIWFVNDSGWDTTAGTSSIVPLRVYWYCGARVILHQVLVLVFLHRDAF